MPFPCASHTPYSGLYVSWRARRYNNIDHRLTRRYIPHLFSKKLLATNIMESKDRICRYDKNMPPYVVDETCYFYQPCVNNLTAEFAEGELLDRVRECLDYNNYSRNHSRCFQFCDGFERILPPIYGSISCLSALCCFGVFLTYFGLPRLRISGYSSKVFLYRCVGKITIFS